MTNRLKGHSGNTQIGPHAVVCAAEMPAEGMDMD